MNGKKSKMLKKVLVSNGLVWIKKKQNQLKLNPSFAVVCLKPEKIIYKPDPDIRVGEMIEIISTGLLEKKTEIFVG